MKIAFSLIILILTILVNCTERGISKVISLKLTRIISNESTHEIIVRSHFNQYDPLLDSIVQIELKSGEKYTTTGEFSAQNLIHLEVFSNAYIETSRSVDSVIVIFDNEKYQIYCNKFIPNGCPEGSIPSKLIIPLPESYHNGDEILFAISEQDYKNAKDCNGHPKCD